MDTKVDTSNISFINCNSPEIRKIWEGNQWLVTKVFAVTYLFFSHNISAFFHNLFSSKSLNTKEIGKIDTLKIPTSSPASPIRLLPYLGVLVGIMGGWASRAINHIPVDQKENCRKVTEFVLPAVNKFKQLELRHFALLSATVPIIFNLAHSVANQPKELPLLQKVKQAVKQQFTSPEFILLSVVTALSLTNPLYANGLGLCRKNGFDSSGHIMLKAALALSMSMILGKTAQISPVFATAYATAYTATDAVFLYNTSYFCHSVYETCAGLAWAGTIVALGHISSSFNWLNKSKVL